MPHANSTAWGRERRSDAAKSYSPFVPAQAGTQCLSVTTVIVALDSRLRGNERREERAIAQPFQCNTQIRVNRRRAVSRSIFTLSWSRSIRMCEPSLWMARRPMSMASILSGVAVRMA